MLQVWAHRWDEAEERAGKSWRTDARWGGRGETYAEQQWRDFAEHERERIARWTRRSAARMLKEWSSWKRTTGALPRSSVLREPPAAPRATVDCEEEEAAKRRELLQARAEREAKESQWRQRQRCAACAVERHHRGRGPSGGGLGGLTPRRKRPKTQDLECGWKTSAVLTFWTRFAYLDARDGSGRRCPVAGYTTDDAGGAGSVPAERRIS